MSEILEIVANEFVVEETLITNTLDIINEESIAVTEEVIALVSEAVQGPQGIPGPKATRANRVAPSLNAPQQSTLAVIAWSFLTGRVGQPTRAMPTRRTPTASLG